MIKQRPSVSQAFRFAISIFLKVDQTSFKSAAATFSAHSFSRTIPTAIIAQTCTVFPIYYLLDWENSLLLNEL